MKGLSETTRPVAKKLFNLNNYLISRASLDFDGQVGSRAALHNALQFRPEGKWRQCRKWRPDKLLTGDVCYPFNLEPIVGLGDKPMEELAMHFSRPFSWFGNSTRNSCLQEPPGRRGVGEHRSAEVRRGAEERADSSQTSLLSRLPSALVPLGSVGRGSEAIALQVAPLIHNSHVKHHCLAGIDVDPLIAPAVVVACIFQPIVMIPAFVLGWQCGFLSSRHVIGLDLWY